MKKIVCVLMILATLLAVLPAGAQESEVFLLSGTIMEVLDDCVMLDVPELGDVQAFISEETTIEGVDALRIGQTAVVLYDGKMTRSLPPQITAQRISVYAVEGTVTEVAEDRVTILRGDELGEVVLTLPENAPELEIGQSVIAYTTGIMTMSLPPIMNAIAFEFEADEPAEEAEDIERIEDVEDAEDVELIEDTEDAGDVVSGQDNG
ncbi:MAG: hypothetical protein PUH70_00700 [Clostridiales bacterium]|nr:hypothetical protein [Clostridiales bacterium]MDY5348315.1 hypothetical protein [Candidatus Ventricola sp.]MDY5513570.1 hypothetical protein [Candidatus Ventricola sp.]